MSDLSAAEFVRTFFESMTEQVVAGEEEAVVVDRYYTPDIVQVVDGVPLDRQRLIDHLRPARRNLVGWRYEVHDALRTEDRLAARFTVHARLRRGREISTEVSLFAEVAPDGRLRRTTQATRDVSRREAS